MERARLTEDQIVGVLKEHEAGAKTADLARKHGISKVRPEHRVNLARHRAKHGLE